MAQLFGKAKEFVANRSSGVLKPKVDLTDVSIKHVSGGSATFRSILEVHNPYSHSIPICGISYSLKSAGKYIQGGSKGGAMGRLPLVWEIASGTMPDPGSIKGNDMTKLEIPLNVPYNFLISIMKDIGRDWDIDYEMRVGLTFDLPIIGNFTLPVSKKGEMKLPTLSDMF